MKTIQKVASVAIAIAAILPAAANADQLMTDAKAMYKSIPTSIPEVKGNTVTRGKIDLGRMLFFDPRLSASHLIS